MVKKKKKLKKRKSSKAGRRKKFPCVCFNQAGHKLYLFVTSAKKLWSIVDINRRAEDKDEGYQRTLSAARIAKIAHFIQGNNVLPTSVLINFDEGKFDKTSSTLLIPDKSNAGWVIDGQHRLAGAHESKVDICLPVVAFLKLSFEEQVECFVTINREQKGVPSSLYYDLLQHIPGGKTEKEMIQERVVDIAKMLRSDESFQFFNRIVITSSPKKGQISLTNFVRKVSPLVKRQGRLYMLPDVDRMGILNNYYKALANVFPKEYKLPDSIFFKTVGFGALMNALPTILDLTLQEFHGFRVVDVTKTFKTIADFDFSDWRKASGSLAESAATSDLIAYLTSSLAGQSKKVIRLE